MLLTNALKNYCIAELSVTAGAADDVFKKAAGEALVSGKMTSEKYAELSKPDAAPAATAFEKRLDDMSSSIKSLVDVVTGLVTPAKAAVVAPTGEAAPSGTKAVEAPLGTKLAAMAGVNPNSDGTGTTVVVKRAHEGYAAAKGGMTYGAMTKDNRPHPMAGQPVIDYGGSGRPVETLSQRDKAICGAYAKFLCSTRQSNGSKSIGFAKLNDHDKDLLQFALQEEKWAGASGNGDDRFADIVDRKLHPSEQKALIDDAISGGLEAAPIVFDDAIITTPLLNGELYPLVNVVPLDRGRRIEGVATGTVTGGWGGVDDSEIALFNTASYVSAFDTTIFRWEGAIKVGLDFLSDSPIDFGNHITQQYGERLLEDLDDVIATGNGSTQPEGVMNKSGATSVNFGGTTSLGNYESLLFGIGKNERRPNVAASTVFCGTDTSYQRARAIPVGANDARRLGGMSNFGGQVGSGGYLNYSWMDHPFKINNSLTNAQIFYAILARYRMYRRRGLTMRTSTEGDTLIRRNEMLMVATARYGGQQERGATIVRTTTAPA